jgi:hypothetical protein
MADAAEKTTETPEVKELKFPDEMAEMAFNALKAFVEKYNSLVGKANAAHGDRVTLTEEITENSTNPKIVAARKKRDEAELELHALVTPEVEKVIADAAGSVKEIEEEVSELNGKIKAGQTYLGKMYDNFDFKDHLPSLARIKGMTVRAGGGTGGRRIRGYRVTTTVDTEVTEHENIASAAKYLDVETTSLQEAFFKAAGDPKALKDAPDEVNFEVEFTEVYDDGEEKKVAQVTAFREVETEDAKSA